VSLQQSFGPNLGLQGLNVRSVGRIVKQTAAVKGLDHKKYHPHLSRQWNAGRSDQQATRTREAFPDSRVFAGFNESDDDILQPGASNTRVLEITELCL
jgi:hypothetical protein